MKYHCPCCDSMQPADHFSCRSGAKGGKIGGKATGAAKARTPEQARAAAKARWAKQKSVEGGKTKTSRPRKPAKVSDE